MGKKKKTKKRRSAQGTKQKDKTTATPSEDAQTSWSLALANGDLQQVQRLLQNGFSVNSSWIDVPMLLVEMQNEHVTVGRHELVHSPPLQVAAAHGHPKVVEFLLSSGAHVNTANALGGT